MPTFAAKVEIEDVQAVGHSELAVKCLIAGKIVWIPQSQIDDDSEVWKEGQSGTLIVSEWIASQKGLI